MEKFVISGEFIPMIQLLKALNWVESGGQAQLAVMDGLVKHNGKVDYRKRLKVRPGDTVELGTQRVMVIANLQLEE